MKLKTLIIHKKTLLILFVSTLLIVVTFCASYFPIRANATPKSLHTIVIDAGHGGRDGGSVGIGGTIEKEINLIYALALRDKLVESGYKVVLTRPDDNGLYDENAKNKKQSDMKARFDIIKQANPSLVISIHMNSFTDKSARGAHTYFRLGDPASRTCANLIQNAFSTYCNAKTNTASVGDYYILNCSYYTAVLIECGFLSNAEEERLLNTVDYRNKVVNAISSALMLYFGNN